MQRVDSTCGDGDIQRRIGEYLRKVLSAAAQGGDLSGYNDLLARLSPLTEDDETEETVLLLKVLADNVSHVDERAHELLLRMVLAVNLWACPSLTAHRIRDFVVNLVSANNSCVVACLDLLVRSFVPPQSPKLDEEAQQKYAARKAEVQLVVVGTLRRVLTLVPAASSALLPLLLRRVPHKRLPAATHCLFLESLFALAEAEEGRPLREEMLLGVVDVLLQVDVDIRMEDIVLLQEEDEEAQAALRRAAGLAGDDSDDDEDDVFQLEELNLAEADQAAEGGADATDPATRRRRPMDETAEKLDSMMDLTVRHLLRREAAGELHLYFATIMRAFDAALLHVHRSKFTQFLLFHACARDATQHNAWRFCDSLMAHIKEGTRPVNTRLAAIAYLASFLARAAFLPAALVVAQLQNLVAICVPMLESTARQASRSAQANVAFSIVQAVLYVLCYRLRQLVSPSADAAAPKEAEASLRALPIRQILMSPLQPHLCCLPSIVSEFLNHAADFGLLPEAEAEALLAAMPDNAARAHAADHPHAARSMAAAARQAVRQCTTGLRPLDSFFPFDPYLLARSAVPLVPCDAYIRWGQSATLAADGAAGSLNGGDDDDEEDMVGAAREEDDDSEDEQAAKAADQQYRQSSISGNTPQGRSVASHEDHGGFFFGGGTSAYRPADGFAKPRALGGTPFSAAGLPHAIPAAGSGFGAHSPAPNSNSSYERSTGDRNSMGGTPMGSFVGSVPMSCTPDLGGFHAPPVRR